MVEPYGLTFTPVRLNCISSKEGRHKKPEKHHLQSQWAWFQVT